MNCGEPGHVQKSCRAPITSYGLIAIKRSSEDPLVVNYLLVQRKDTMAFVDLVRGKQDDLAWDPVRRSKLLEVYAAELTHTERNILLTRAFTEIWNALWCNHNSGGYLMEFAKASESFGKLDLRPLFDRIPCVWRETEYGLPKGRKTSGETRLECAKREFTEETGYTASEYEVLPMSPVVETYTGTNDIEYCHVYYIAVMKPWAGPPRPINENNPHQRGEIKTVRWFTFNECLKAIRSYERQKKMVLQNVHYGLVPGLLRSGTL